mmetsp:Transcript_1310/g.1668  ORF Transcript_1310/g.1668 Transcript_1310/m.1668 type:complete len:234 (-) Transcript_1310:929-1630(-)
MKATQFSGFSQHDSQEMLSFLLELLHEDVNKVSRKPYVEYKDSNGRQDEEISQEFWEGFQKREKSIFVDLFYGQLKSRVQCTRCDNISLTFDPFNVLSVPLPSEKKNRLLVKYFPFNMRDHHFEFYLTTGDYLMVDELRDKVGEFIIKTKFADKPTSEWLPPLLTAADNKNNLQLFQREKVIGVQMKEELVFFEREPFTKLEMGDNEDMSNYFFCEIRQVQTRRSYLLFNSSY